MQKNLIKLAIAALILTGSAHAMESASDSHIIAIREPLLPIAAEAMGDRMLDMDALQVFEVNFVQRIDADKNGLDMVKNLLRRAGPLGEENQRKKDYLKWAVAKIFPEKQRALVTTIFDLLCTEEISEFILSHINPTGQKMPYRIADKLINEFKKEKPSMDSRDWKNVGRAIGNLFAARESESPTRSAMMPFLEKKIKNEGKDKTVHTIFEKINAVLFDVPGYEKLFMKLYHEKKSQVQDDAEAILFSYHAMLNQIKFAEKMNTLYKPACVPESMNQFFIRFSSIKDMEWINRIEKKLLDSDLSNDVGSLLFKSMIDMMIAVKENVQKNIKEENINQKEGTEVIEKQENQLESVFSFIPLDGADMAARDECTKTLIDNLNGEIKKINNNPDWCGEHMAY